MIAPLLLAPTLLLLCAGLLPLALAPSAAAAAEIRQIRTSTLVQVGDSNRSYSVRLACIEPVPGQEQAAMDWLRRQAPRGARVNLRPLGEQEGELVARVRVLGRGSQQVDLADGLLQQGMVRPAPAGQPSCSTPAAPSMPAPA